MALLFCIFLVCVLGCFVCDFVLFILGLFIVLGCVLVCGCVSFRLGKSCFVFWCKGCSARALHTKLPLSSVFIK